MSYSLISSILKKSWAIDPSVAVGYGNFVSKLLSGESVQLREEASLPYVKRIQSESNTDSIVGICVLPVQGPLTKNGGWCSIGTSDMVNYLKQADKDSDIDAILLHMDTPGGTVDGTETLASAVEKTKKPVYAFVDGLCASAGMWIASKADKIIASTEHDEVGSIGVLLSFMDIQPMWEEKGVKFHTITADQSSDKVKWFEELRAGKYDNYKKDKLNPLAEKFQKVIKESRPGITDDLLTGKLYFAKDVLGSLVDEIGSFDYAFNQAAQSANSNNNSNSTAMSKKTQNKPFEDDKSALNWFQQVLSGNTSGKEKTEEKTEDKIESIKQERFVIENENAQLTMKLKEEKQAKQDLQSQLTQLAEELKELKGQAGESSAVAPKRTDGNKNPDPARIDLPETGSIEEQFAAFSAALDNPEK